MDKSIKRSKMYIILAATTLIAIVAIFLITLMLSVLSQIMGSRFRMFLTQFLLQSS